jgi:hypothetical protein
MDKERETPPEDRPEYSSHGSTNGSAEGVQNPTSSESATVAKKEKGLKGLK